jgi:SAM-dependent methyltransferase
MQKNTDIGRIIIDKLRISLIIDYADSLFNNLVILDLGCGNQPYRRLFFDKTRTYIGLDWPYSKHKCTDVDIYADAQQIPFEDSLFDVVICTELLEHTKEPLKVLLEINRVLKKGGSLFLTTPFMVPIHEPPNDYYRFTQYSLLYLSAAAKFEVVSIRTCGNLIGTITTFCSTIQLKAWTYLAKVMKIPLLASIYNPFIFIGVYLPQYLYLNLVHRFVKDTGLSYSPLGYCAILKKN